MQVAKETLFFSKRVPDFNHFATSIIKIFLDGDIAGFVIDVLKDHNHCRTAPDDRASTMMTAKSKEKCKECQ